MVSTRGAAPPAAQWIIHFVSPVELQVDATIAASPDARLLTLDGADFVLTERESCRVTVR